MTSRVPPRLRDLTSADATRILDITRRTGVFREEELGIAAKVFADETKAAAEAKAAGPAQPGELPYYLLGAELDGTFADIWLSTPGPRDHLARRAHRGDISMAVGRVCQLGN